MSGYASRTASNLVRRYLSKAGKPVHAGTMWADLQPSGMFRSKTHFKQKVLASMRKRGEFTQVVLREPGKRRGVYMLTMKETPEVQRLVANALAATDLPPIAALGEEAATAETEA